MSQIQLKTITRSVLYRLPSSAVESHLLFQVMCDKDLICCHPLLKVETIVIIIVAPYMIVTVMVSNDNVAVKIKKFMGKLKVAGGGL